MNTILSIGIEGFGSLTSTLVLIATTIGAFVMWLRERKKRKYDDVKAKQDIVDLLNQKNDECMTAVVNLRNTVATLTGQVETQRVQIERQENEIKSLRDENTEMMQEITNQQETIEQLKTENHLLKTRQAELIAENKRLNSTLESLKFAGKRKVPVPKRKDAQEKEEQ